MATTPAQSRPALLVQAIGALKVSRKAFGQRLGVSSKTVTRWCARDILLPGRTVATLCADVHPIDARLAARIASAYGYDLAQLGVAPPAPATAPVASSEAAESSLHADALVCTAADVADVSPRAMRPALVAAFTRARELGLTLDSALALLSAAASKKR